MENYLFWFESEGKEGWTFEIEADDSEDAFVKAYHTHGPQVEGMLCQVVKPNNQDEYQSKDMYP